MSIRIPKHWDLEYWRTGEWQVIKERLKDEAEYNPSSSLLFASLGAVHPDAIRVAILGQDPYPNAKHCTGVAFSIPRTLEEREWPPTLVNILKEYEDDLGYPAPKNGDLTKWCEQGVLLWNVYPSCRAGHPGSHRWNEWEYLTNEIINKLEKNRVIFVSLGRVATDFIKHLVDPYHIRTSHPSPLGVRRGFSGSRIFTRVNVSLADLGHKPIDWRLQ